MLRSTPGLFWLALLLIVAPLLHVGWVLSSGEQDSDSLLFALLPERVYDVEVAMRLQDAAADGVMRTYLPVGSERQDVLAEQVLYGPGPTLLENDASGRLATWRGDAFANASAEMAVRYAFQVRVRGLKVDLDDLPPVAGRVRRAHLPFLEPTADVQSDSPEILDALQQIGAAPDSIALLTRIQLIFDEISSFRPAPFKGTTDALTTLRLREASCNGRSRSMVAMLRNIGVPARLVGGLILTNGTKKTSHQWLEAHLGGVWVPFDALNGHFGSLPANYLRMYTGDQPMFRHSSGLPFDYSYAIASRLSLPQEGLSAHQVWRAFDQAGIPVSLLRFLLLMPIGAVIVALLRNVVGMQTFGLFLPALLAVSMRETGFAIGAGAFVLVIGLVALLHPLLERWRLMYTPRLVILLIAVVALFLGISALGVHLGQTQFAYITLFPIVIVAITAERLARKWEEWGAKLALWTALQTLVVVGIAYIAMGSLLLEAMLLAFPTLYLVLVGTMLFMGRWTGVRVSEWFRFRRVEGQALGMNARNVMGVFRGNSSQAIAIANDKIATKTMLAAAGVPVSPQRGVFPSVLSLEGLRTALDRPVALKPAAGRGGGGILLIQPDPDDSGFVNIHGKPVAWSEIIQHATEIIHGRFSFGDEDVLLVEDLLVPHPEIAALHGKGIADFRFIFERHNLLMAMLRLPTAASDGKANLHAGGVGASVDLATGRLGVVVGKQGVSDRHPDGQQVKDVAVPEWEALLAVARQAAAISPLGFVGVDLVLDANLGPVVLEWNARPGLEIQNVHAQPLQLDATEAIRPPRPWGIVAVFMLLFSVLMYTDAVLFQQWAAAADVQWQVSDAAGSAGFWQWQTAEDSLRVEEQGEPSAMLTVVRAAEQRKDWRQAAVGWEQLVNAEPNLVHWSGLARARMRTKSWSDALEAYDAVLALDSMRHSAWVNSGIALSHLQRPSSSAKRYQRAQAIEPTKMSAWINEGIAWVRAEEFEKALAPLRHVVERSAGEDRAKALIYLGQAWLGLGDREQAEESFREAITLKPDSELARVGLASLQKDPEEGLRLVDQVLRLHPSSSLAYAVQARFHVAVGAMAKAESAWQRALDLDPENEELLRELADFYLSQGRSEEASALLNSGEGDEQLEDGPSEWFIRGKLASDQGRDAEAVGHYERALALSAGEMAAAWLNQGVVYRRMGQTRNALASYRSAALAREPYPEAWYNMALAFVELAQLDSAVWAYRQCITQDPNMVNAHYNLGVLYSEQGNADQAIAAWHSAVRTDPGMRKAWFNLGVNLRRAGRPEEAVAAYDSLLVRYPKDERAWFNRGIALKDLGDVEGALASYRAALEADPNYVSAWMNFGSTQADLGDYAAAASAFREAAERDPGSPEARFNLGLQLKRLGETDEAVFAFEQSAQLDVTYDRPRNMLLELYAEAGDERNRLRIENDGLPLDSVLSWGGDSIYEYGRALHRADWQQRAVGKYDLAMAEGKIGPWPQYWKAKAMEEMGDNSLAIDGYLNLLANVPDFKFGLYRCAMLLGEVGQQAEAQEMWRELENLHPEFAQEKWEDKP
jgi:alpha-L-glutamate ligase-like protein